jgi:hypothetical protein
LVVHTEVAVECLEDQVEEVAQFVEEIRVAGMDKIANPSLDTKYPDRAP